MNNIQRGLMRTSGYLQRHSPVIMTGLGVAGVVTTTIFAVKATPKAMRLIEEANEVLSEDDILSPIDKVKIAWRPYAPAVIMGSLTIACILSAHQINTKRNTALAGLYSLTENRLRDYQRQVVETVGEKKEQEVRDAVAAKEIEKNPPSGDIITIKDGTMLCYESLSGRYFRSDVETIKSVFNELNRKIISNNYMVVYLNDFYDELGLSPTRVGDMLGWEIDDGEVDYIFSSQLTENNEPCLVVNFSVEPRADIAPY